MGFYLIGQEGYGSGKRLRLGDVDLGVICGVSWLKPWVVDEIAVTKTGIAWKQGEVSEKKPSDKQS